MLHIQDNSGVAIVFNRHSFSQIVRRGHREPTFPLTNRLRNSVIPSDARDLANSDSA
jgi:hypothetical protein